MYYVIEFQTNAGQGAVLTYSFSDITQAYNKFHTIMAAAAVSSIERHGAMIIADNLYVVKKELAWREGHSEPESED